MHLLDVNFLYALSSTDHIFHDLAQDWYAKLGDEKFATCAINESGLVRLLTNRSIQTDPLDIHAALKQLRKIHAKPNHVYIDSMPGLAERGIKEVISKIHGYRQTTDAYLIALAKINGGKFVTFDKKLAETFDADDLVIIPVS